MRPRIEDLCALFRGDVRFAEEARPGGIIDRNRNRILEIEESNGLVELARGSSRYAGTKVKELFEQRFGPGAIDRPDASARLDRLARLEQVISAIDEERMDRIGWKLCTDPEFDHRWAASAKYENVVQFFADEFRDIGMLPAGEMMAGRRTYFDLIAYEQRFVRPSTMAETKNVYAVLPGTEPDPEKKKTILLVVHADGISEAEIEDYGRERFPTNEHQGANDNAAACVAALEFCRKAKELGGFKDDIMVWVTSAEEDGLLGTEAACVKPPIAPEKIRSAFVLEMIGRNAVDDLHVFGGEKQPDIEWNRFDDRVARVAEKHGIGVKRGKPLVEDPEHWCVRSDWEVLENFGVQIAGIFGGADPSTYHTPLDTWDKINLDKLRTVVELMLRTCQDLDDDPNPQERTRPASSDLNPHFPGRVQNPDDDAHPA